MDPKKPMTGLGLLILAAVATATAVLAGAGVWYWQYSANGKLKDELTVAQDRIVLLESQVRQLEAAASRVTTPTAPADNDSASPGSVDGVPPSGAAERQFAYITDVNETAGDYEWVLDYAQFLTGDAAADAAAAAGGESPPPNDYYILNENAKLRTFPVAAGAKVTLYYDGVSDKRVLNAGQYFDAWTNRTDGKHAVPFWVTIEDGKIVAAEEQYLP